MDTRYKLVIGLTFVVAALAGLAAPQPVHGQDKAWQRMLKASEAEQAAWIRSALAQGAPPTEEIGGVLTMLILSRSAVTLPLIEQKIEEVLRSSSPSELFTDKSIDPQNFVHQAAVDTISAGDLQSLKEASKLLQIDEKQFGWMVERTLIQARSYRNPFIVAYRGLEIGDPAVDSRIAAWAEVELAEKRPPLRSRGPRDPEPVPEFEIHQVRQMWAEAMVERYGGVPTESQWVGDPLVSRLNTALSGSVHKDVLRFALETVERRNRK